ncbi:MAG: hypothetical protein K2P87_08660 [Lachnospiraceae bacterium]|nr:hypothetical protein [Lachnospiraceae bacterium]
MKKKTKGLRIAAIVCVVALLGMYVATFAAAVTAKPYSGNLFIGCVLCTIFVPIFLHVLIRMFAIMTERQEGDTTLYEIHRTLRRKRKGLDGAGSARTEEEKAGRKNS